jgi:hypothetical protein
MVAPSTRTRGRAHGRLGSSADTPCKGIPVESNRVDEALSGRADSRGAASSAVLLREQRMRALSHANQIRTARATLKAELAAGRARIEDVLTSPPAFAATAKVSDFLLAVPGLGPARAVRALTRCQIPHGKTAGTLSERQRVVLIALLRTEMAGTI